MKLLILFIFFLISAPCSATDARRAALLGTWICGPYAMAGEEFSMTVVESATYLDNGNYLTVSDLKIRLKNGKIITTRDRSSGRWALTDDLINIHYDKVEFLSSDDPDYTIQMGQAAADAQQKKKSWAKYRILELQEKLIILPVKPMYEAAASAVTCVRS